MTMNHVVLDLETLCIAETEAIELLGCSPRRWKQMLERKFVVKTEEGFPLKAMLRGALAFERAKAQRHRAKLAGH